MDVKEENKESDPVDDNLRFNLAQKAKSPIYADFNILRAAEAKDEFIEDSGLFLKTIFIFLCTWWQGDQSNIS